MAKKTLLRQEKEPGVNRKLIENALSSWKLPRVDTKDPKAIKERIQDYLNHCMKCDMPPTHGGCANWLGVTVDTLERWYTGKHGTTEHQNIMIRFYALMQELWGTEMHDGTINPVAGIFMGKVFYGYKDTQEIVVKTDKQEQISTADLIAESRLLPGAEALQITDAQKEVITAEAREIPAEQPQKEEAQKEEEETQKKKRGRPRRTDKTEKELKKEYRDNKQRRRNEAIDRISKMNLE